jgi:two-component system, chemotaxis family, chemotaxis protein CheY
MLSPRPANLGGRHILVADEDPKVVEFVIRTLRADGFAVFEDSALIRSVTRVAFPATTHQLHEAENGRQALELLDRTLEPFDAIILDLRMPEMNGVESVEAIRQRPLHRDTPIVVASSEGENTELGQAIRRLGVAAVVKKLPKPQELAETVGEACRAR